MRVEPGVQRVHDRADDWHADMAFNHFGGVRQHDGHDVALSDPEGAQGVAQLACPAVRLRPGATNAPMQHGEPLGIHLGRAPHEVHWCQRRIVGAVLGEICLVDAHDVSCSQS